MKRNNKKGFTIVELVVVIAVIAILSAVFIPTFSGVIGKAKEAALKADLKAVYTQYASDKALAEEDVAETVYIKVEDKYYEVVKGNTKNATEVALPACYNRNPLAGGLVFEKANGEHTNTVVDCKCDTCGTVIDESKHSVTDGVCNVCGNTIN